MEKFIEFMGDFASGAGPAVKAGKAVTTAAVTQFDRQMFAKAYRKVYKELLKKNPGEADEIMATIHRFSAIIFTSSAEQRLLPKTESLSRREKNCNEPPKERQNEISG